MSGREPITDWDKRFEDLEERVRYLEVQRQGHTESKTFITIAGLPVFAGMAISALIVGIDQDGETPEWKQLHGFAATLETGTAIIKWQLNGVDLNTGRPIDTGMDMFDLSPAQDLEHGDKIRPIILEADGATGLSAAAFFVTAVI